MGWVLDLDGVVWLAHHPLPGAAELVARLRATGEPVLFVTNNAQFGRATVAEQLSRVGIPASAGDVLTSATAAATLIAPGERVLAFAGPGVTEALTERGAEVISAAAASTSGDPCAVDTVVVGRHLDFDFASLTAAARAVVAGARLVATNADPAYPTPHGPEPGAGTLLAAVETASGRRAEVIAGKPHAPMAALVAAQLGSAGWVVGDAPSTDGLLAQRLGYRFGLVLSGVTATKDLPVTPPADLVAADLRGLVEAILASAGQGG